MPSSLGIYISESFNDHRNARPGIWKLQVATRVILSIEQLCYEPSSGGKSSSKLSGKPSGKLPGKSSGKLSGESPLIQATTVLMRSAIMEDPLAVRLWIALLKGQYAKMVSINSIDVLIEYRLVDLKQEQAKILPNLPTQFQSLLQQL